MKQITLHSILLCWLGLILGVVSLSPGKAAAVCSIDPNGTYIDADHYSGISTQEEYTGPGKINTKHWEVREYEVNFPVGKYEIWFLGKGNDDKSIMYYDFDDKKWEEWDKESTSFIWTSFSFEVDSPKTHTIRLATSLKGQKLGEVQGLYITEEDNAEPDSNTPSGSDTIINPNAGCAGAQWQIEPPSLGPTCFYGYDAESISFTLTNIGEDDSQTATVNSDASWAVPADSTIPALDRDEPHTVTVDFSTADLLAGTHEAEITITGAASNSPLTIPITLLVKDAPATAPCGKVPLYAENLVNPAVMVILDTSGSMRSTMRIAAIDEQKTGNIRNIVQAITNRTGWVENNGMGFVLSHKNGRGRRLAWSYDGQNTDAPKLSITYTKDGSTTTITRTISNSNSDVQVSGSTLNTTSTYLELGRANGPVGLLFKDIAVPAGATITAADISFTAYQGDYRSMELTIRGIDADDITSLTPSNIENVTAASRSWQPGSWTESMRRIDIAKDVLKETFRDRSIAWGYGTWAGGRSGRADESDDAPNYYTKYHIGVHEHDDEHQEKLQDNANEGTPSGWTPLVPALKGALEYFKGKREDLEYEEKYSSLDCQPRIVVLVTDGEGNTGTSNPKIRAITDAFITEGVSLVTVGFGLDTTYQLDIIAQKMKEAGEASDDDYLYHLHKEDSEGVAVPFMAQNRQEFLNAMNDIASSVKAEAFHGASPAPTTSADNGEILLNASFHPSGWSGDLTATKFDADTGVLEDTPLWSAKAQMPADINAFIFDHNEQSKVSKYTETSLDGDNYLCKKLGDIINSTPVIVSRPPNWYTFDSYITDFKNKSSIRKRDALVYVGANDGALHAFNLKDGVEKWRFYPKSVKNALSNAKNSPLDDMCSDIYCHKYLLDGSPAPADIYTEDGWKTILTTGVGEGGYAYFALDITYGEDFDADTNASKLLWEFTDNELGLATSILTTARVKNGDDTYGWATFFASGKMATDMDQENKEAYLFAVNSWDKSHIWKDGTGIYKVKLSSDTLKNDYATAPLLVEKLDEEYVFDRIYLGNQYGNMYRVNNIGFGEKPTTSLFYDSKNSNHTTPITAKAQYAPVGNGDIWLYFGTGSYVDEIDKFTSAQQYFLGLLDEKDGNPDPYVKSNLIQMSAEIIEGYAIDKDGNTTGDLSKYRTVSCLSPDGEGRCNPLNRPWLLELAVPDSGASERVISQPLVISNIVFFTTFIPHTDPCEGGGETWLFAVDWQTGEFVTDAVFDVNKDGSFTTADTSVKSGGEEKQIIGIFLGSGTPSDKLELHRDLLVTGTTTQPYLVKLNLPGMRAKLRSWRQQYN